MLAKSMRVERLVTPLCSLLGLAPDSDALRHALAAAPLASADLGTAMVMEFTDLAGVMGRHYAKLEGREEEVRRGRAGRKR